MIDEVVKQFAFACRTASRSVNSPEDLKQFAEKLRELVKGDDVEEQIMSVILNKVCWQDCAKTGELYEEVEGHLREGEKFHMA